MSINANKILIVDDEPDILEFLEYNLVKEGYKVICASNGQEGVEKAKEILPGLIILDVMMPVMSGIEACRELREVEALEDALIVFLTARSEDYLEIDGLESGGDDFITKPVRPKVLTAKVKSLLRRINKNETNSFLEFDNLKVDKEARVIYVNDEEVHLPKKEYKLLLLLLSKPGKVFERDEILKDVWGEEVFISDRTIDVHIRKLRGKIGEDKFLTIKGIGYKFVG